MGERFPEPHRTPVLLDCGHTLCAMCLDRVRQRGKKCPMCKDILKTSAGRPDPIVRAVFRFFNTLPIARGTSDLLAQKSDLQEVCSAVVGFRENARLAMAVPLQQAVRAGNIEQVRMYLSRCSNCNIMVNGETALHVAINSRQFDVVLPLLEHSADATVPTAGFGDTPILLACGSYQHVSRIGVVIAMLKSLSSADVHKAVNLANKGGATPIYRVSCRLAELQHSIFADGQASYKEEAELAQLLIKMNADLDRREGLGLFVQSAADILRGIKDPLLPALLELNG